MNIYRPGLPSCIFPVALACPAFNNFIIRYRRDCHDQKSLECALNLQIEMSKNFTSEREKEKKLHVIFESYLGLPAGSFVTQIKSDNIETDGTVFQDVNGQRRILLNLEVKNEIGSQGDPCAQNLAYYIKILQNFSESLGNWQKELGVRPAFLVQVAGANLQIACACANSYGVHFDVLTPYLNLEFVPHDIEKQYMIGRALYALKTCLEDLRVYNISKEKPNPDFPFVISFESGEATFTLHYEKELKQSSRTIFKCITKPDDLPVVVKFSPFGYGVKAHEILACEGMAPNLLFSKDLQNGFTMVVMEYIDGECLNKLSRKQKKMLRQAVSLLHSHGFVHGDLRPQNVLWKGFKPYILDFDFARLEKDKPLYPASLNPEVTWAKGVEAMGLIEKVHDNETVESHFDVRGIEEDSDEEMEVEMQVGKRKIC